MHTRNQHDESDTSADGASGGSDKQVAGLIVERLRAWGTERIYGYAGDGNNPLLGALRRASDGPAFIQAKHEESAAFMAVGEAKFTGGVGVVTSTQGPGAVHLLNPLYDAKLDSAPVVALVAQQHQSVLGSDYQQEIDLQHVFHDVAAVDVGAARAARGGSERGGGGPRIRRAHRDPRRSRGSRCRRRGAPSRRPPRRWRRNKSARQALRR
ncbi:hypothetical protein GCM10010915_24790 [Microbacterium faecale]|uniref:Thiamine pyrophosphate enzyme N-terminal TPP-binding domain-containing protein n=1 Tax=Microbacterium faecale TaxID=1804630 RepID=A0A917DJU6_9MICO|nr:thiamine pyrophosphate-binding protein [Microbacterium faecale]GGD42746.1 hypothetical protein GCM10010915_24790 [Microbacterium faecale]